MSSLGNQWRVIRHYLSLSNLNVEVEKLMQKMKPLTPDQWESFMKKLEISYPSILKGSQATQPIASTPVVNTTKVEDTNAEAEVKQEENEKIDEKPNTTSVGSEISFESIMEGLRLKKNLHFGQISEPKWKSNKPLVTKVSIHSRTSHVVAALGAASSDACRARRAAHLVDHLLRHPEARDYAIKEGAVRALLRARHELDDSPAAEETRGLLNEGLALVGVVPRGLGSRGPRVLSLDGGGVRGLATVRLLAALQAAAGVPLVDLFDLVVGVSTGAIIAALIGSGKGTLQTAEEMYLTLSKQMFGNTSIISGTSRLVWSHSYYDTDAWEKLLQHYLGDVTITQCNRIGSPQLALVSCASGSGGGASPFVFRSYGGGHRARSQYAGGAAPLWQCVRASAAAPTYFHHLTLAGRLHQDGGIMVNNPAGVALHEARLLFGPRALRRATLVSVGTGRHHRHHHHHHHRAPPTSSWRDKFNRILDSATDTEGVHQMMSDLLPAGSYFRLNPPLLNAVPLDGADPQSLAGLARDAAEYCRRNQHKIAQAAARLTEKRSLAQRAADRLQHRALLLGIIDHPR